MCSIKRLRSAICFAVMGVCGTVHFAAHSVSAAEGSADFGIPQVKFINERIGVVMEEYGITPSSPATEGEWCRRVYLDILGRIPSYQELKAFMTNSSPDKKRELVDSLLYDEKYTEEYARNWTTIWTNVLIGRSGGTERNTLTSRPGLQKYLRDSFARNKPYDRMVYELVTATGVNKPGHPNFNGAVNFLAMKVNEEKGTQATGDVSKIFLGLQVQCTQCHNHPFNEWKQQKFWEFNAFFRQTRTLRNYVEGTREIDYAELINEDFAGEGIDPSEAEIYYEKRNGEVVVAYPVFIDNTPIDPSGYVEDVERRTELGKLVIESEYLGKMIANRMWAHYLGYGFTKPIDDLGPHNPPSHPQLLEYLGEQIREQSFNLKELTRWITLSEAYGRSSRMTSGNENDDPLLGESPKFSHFYMRQMRAEELYESLLVATQAHKTSGTYEEQEKKKTEWLQQFTLAFGTDEGGEATTFNGTIPQALMMMNGELTRKATSEDEGSFLWVVGNSKLAPAKQIEYLFLAALARKPSSAELRIANDLLRARAYDNKGNFEAARVAALQDVWWAVLNSNEFILNH